MFRNALYLAETVVTSRQTIGPLARDHDGLCNVAVEHNVRSCAIFEIYKNEVTF